MAEKQTPLLMTQQQAAAYLGVGTRTIAALRREGRIPVVMAERKEFIPRPALDKWLESVTPEAGNKGGVAGIADVRAMLRKRAG